MIQDINSDPEKITRNSCYDRRFLCMSIKLYVGNNGAVFFITFPNFVKSNFLKHEISRNFTTQITKVDLSGNPLQLNKYTSF